VPEAHQPLVLVQGLLDPRLGVTRLLDFAEIPPNMFTSMFTCARTAGWSAHILEEKRTGRLIRPSSRYVGPSARPVRDVQGADEVLDKDV